MRCLVLGLAVVASACTPAQAPAAKRTGMVMSIVGVVGLTASAAASLRGSDTRDLVIGFSVISGVGISTYAIVELSNPADEPKRETEQQKMRRWAKTVTEWASGAAREGKCGRVRRLEKRVNLYDREIHDFVFMKDAEIVRCLDRPPSEPAPEAPVPIEPEGLPPLVPPPAP